jgi:hypothetical protein
MLHYILLHRKGDIYNKLVNLLQHHSLSTLLIELLQLKIVPAAASQRDRFSSDFDKFGDNDDEEPKRDDPTAKMNPTEKEMYEILNQKKQEVIHTLIERLSNSNKDLEQTLNAHTILLEIADNE